MATIYTYPKQAQAISDTVAADDDDWTYAVDLLPGRQAYAVGTYADLGRFIGFL